MEATEMQELKELIEFLKANEIAEFDLERGELKVKLKFMGAVQAAAPAAPGMDMGMLARLMAQGGGGVPQAGPAAAGAAPAGAVAGAAAVPVVEEKKNHVVKSPIVGTFYEAPSPGSPPFVKVGDTVEVGQVLCIVEAMKLMNEIESDMAGEIVERIAAPGQPVEYGQPLFAIRAK